MDFESTDIAQLLVAGLAAHLREQLASNPSGYTIPTETPNQSGRSARGKRQARESATQIACGEIVCVYRMLNKSIRSAVDEWIREWLEGVKVLRDNAYHLSTSDLAFEAMKRFEDCLRECYPKAVAEGMRAQITAQGGVNVFCLSDDVTTFICMCTQRCQVHATNHVAKFTSISIEEDEDSSLWKRGKLHSPCRGANVASNVDFKTNLSTLPSGKVIYACPGCTNAASLELGFDFCRMVARSKYSKMRIVRSMLRMARAHPMLPCYSAQALCHSTRCWGNVNDEGVSKGIDHPTLEIEDTHCGTKFLAIKHWPKKTLIANIPLLSGSQNSLQQMLRLTEDEMCAVSKEFMRKEEQRANHKRSVKELYANEMIQDVDSAISKCKEIPFGSVSELKTKFLGMGATLELACRTNLRRMRHHEVDDAMDIDLVRSIFNTLRAFFTACGPVVLTWDAASVDFYSGMCVGLYGKLNPEWARGHMNIAHSSDAVKKFSHDQRSLEAAMRFFDTLDANSLKFYEKRPQRIAICGSGRYLEFVIAPNVSLRSSSEFTAMCEDIQCLMDKAYGDVHLSALNYRDYSRGMTKHVPGIKTSHEKSKMEASGKVEAWLKAIFKVLAKRKRTRFAALDIMGIKPEDILAQF